MTLDQLDALAAHEMFMAKICFGTLFAACIVAFLYCFIGLITRAPFSYLWRRKPRVRVKAIGVRMP